MKKPKIFTTILLSLLLIVGLLCTSVFFAASQLFQKENVTSLLNGISTGEKILQYEHLPEDTEQSNIYDRLAREVPLQVALVVGISEKDAEICQNGAFAYLKSRQLDKQAYTTFDSIAEELGIGYTQTAVADNIINPNEIDAILIQPGKDMITLLTCHPYGSGGLYRYLVYCERV